MIHTDSRLLFLDFEATGTDPHKDRIVEVCLLRTDGQSIVTRVNPGRPIPPEATAVHGITDEDVQDEPRFKNIAPGIQAIVAGAVLCGYNIRRYDTLLLDAELRRSGEAGLPRAAAGMLAVQEIDLYRLWSDAEPRTLEFAAKRFAGQELGETAHSAEADTKVLPAVLAGMIVELALEEDVESLCRRSIPAGEVDREGKFIQREDGVVLLNFTQKKGAPAKEDPGLLHWIVNRDFSAETKAVAYALLEELNQERLAAIAKPAAVMAAQVDDDELPF